MGKIKPDQTEYILPRCNFFKTKTEFDKKKKINYNKHQKNKS